MVNGPASTVIHPEDHALVSRLAHGKFRQVRKDGSTLWVKETLRAARDSDGRPVVLLVCEDITERKRAEERLRAATQKLELLIQTSPLAIMSLDTTGDTVVRWNRAAEEMFGWHAEEVLGRPFPSIPPNLEEESNALWERAVREGCLRGVELRRRRKDGTLIDVALWVTIVKDAHGRIMDTFGIVEDITERKRAQAALQDSQDRLQRALREREQLARNLHDNIIQSISAIGFALEECQELLNGASADAHRKLSQVIAELNRIIREVRGYLATPVEESDTLSADELMASLRHMGRLMESADGMRFSLTIDPAAARLLTAGQRAQFLYLAQEAMSNSLRHSRARQYNRRKPRHRITTHARNRRQPGDAHRRRDPMPLREKPRTVIRPLGEGDRDPGAGSKARPIRLLLVDDHEVVRLGLRTLFNRSGTVHVIGEAGTMESAIAEAVRLKPDAVLMDIRLPDGDGIEACREIRAERPEARVLFLTSYSDEAAVLSTMVAGAAGFLLKEIGGSALVQAVEAVARGQSIFDPAAVRRIIAQMQPLAGDEKPLPEDTLSPRDERILALVAEGKTNKEIGRELGVSDKTIKNLLSVIFQKLQISRRSQAAALFVKRASVRAYPGLSEKDE